jgi:hypothetical protein
MFYQSTICAISNFLFFWIMVLPVYSNREMILSSTQEGAMTRHVSICHGSLQCTGALQVSQTHSNNLEDSFRILDLPFTKA